MFESLVALWLKRRVLVRLSTLQSIMVFVPQRRATMLRIGILGICIWRVKTNKKYDSACVHCLNYLMS